MARKAVDHTYMGTDGFKCKHCGATKAVQMPIAIRDFAKAVDAFNAVHGKCKKPK